MVDMGDPVRGRPCHSCCLDGPREVDVRVDAIGGVVARNQIRTAGVDDVEATDRIESDLDEIAECKSPAGATSTGSTKL